MLEILALIYFIKQIKKVATEKGIKPGKWIAALVISWFVAEILIIVLALIVFDIDDDAILVTIIPALLGAVGVAFFILHRLKQQEPVVQIEEG